MGAMSPFQTYIRLFAEASKQDPTAFSKRFKANHLRAFNVRISNWKTTNHWTNDHVCALIFFCYYHNPLLLDDITLYGNLDNIGRCVSLFSKWVRANKETLESVNMIKLVLDTALTLDADIVARALNLEDARALYARDKS